jgi:RimJ/RimL family protein N-acetyltransferase
VSVAAEGTPWPPEVELKGGHAWLAPLTPEHARGLAEAVKDGELWTLWYTNIASPETMAEDVASRLARREAGQCLPFVVLDPTSGAPVGMTNYWNIDAPNRRVEIGGTWYRRAVQRSALNTECKRMLLAHAFETLDCIAVEFRTHFLNHQSRRAIERLGARLDGVLRNHSFSRDGLLRDTCVYSILQSEWPAVRRHLDFRLERQAV